MAIGPFGHPAWSGAARVRPYPIGSGEDRKANGAQVDAYTLFDLAAGTAVRVGGHPVRLDLAGRNLTNASYGDVLSRYTEFVLNPGRDIQLRATTSF